jgi:Flp pilus assembly protein TadG
MITLLRRLSADQKGASAIEFALVFPLLFLLHVAAAEALQAYVAQRNVAHIAAAMADITARNRTVSTADLADIQAVSIAMMHPFPTGKLQQRVSSITADGNGTAATDWTSKKNYTKTEAPSVPGGYLRANESVIVTDVIYDYEPTFGFFMPDTIRMTKHAYVRPRLSAKVEKVS